ncbi:MAG: DUF2231 domain-containing protein [Thermoanaerobaculia bacterium]
MIEFPPIPTWDGLHPLIIHFPIALLYFAPIFILVGAAVRPKGARSWLTAGLILMAVGTVTVFVAISTGESAAELAERSAQVNSVLERHETLAEQTEIVFSSLTVIFAVMLFAPRLFKREPERVTTTLLPLVFLLFYGAGMVILTNTAHNGGRLVHEFGVQSLVASSGPTAFPAALPAETDED